MLEEGEGFMEVPEQICSGIEGTGTKQARLREEPWAEALGRSIPGMLGEQQGASMGATVQSRVAF